MRRVVRRLGQIAGLAMLLVLVGVAVIVVGARTRPGARMLRELVRDQLQRRLAGPLEIRALRTDLLSELVAEGVVLRDPDGFAAITIERMRARYEVLPLRHRVVRIRALELGGVTVSVRRLTDGRVNLAALLAPRGPDDPRAAAPPSLRIELDRVEVGGSVSLFEEAAAHGRVTGAVRYADGELQIERAHATLDAPGAAIDPLLGELRLAGAYRLTVEADGSLRDLGVSASLATPSRPIELDGRLSFEPRFAWRGRARASRLDPGRLLVGAPSAALSFELSGQGGGDQAILSLSSARVEAGPNLLDARGSARLAAQPSADVTIDVRARDLSRLACACAGTVSGRVHVALASALRVEGALEGRALALPGVRLAALTVDGSLRGDHGEAVVRAREVVLHAMPRALDLDLAVAVRPRFDHGLLPSAAEAEVTALEIGAGHERWRGRPGAKISIGRELSVRGLELRASPQVLAIDARLDRRGGAIDVALRGRALDLHRLVSLVGDAASVPPSAFDLTFSAKGSASRPRGRLALTGTIRSTTLSLEIEAPIRTDLRVLRRSREPVSLVLSAQVASLTDLTELLGDRSPPYLHEGALDARLTIEGTIARPSYRLVADATGVRLASVAGLGTRAQVVSDGDSARLDGAVTLDGAPLLTTRGVLGIDLPGLVRGMRFGDISIDAVLELPALELGSLATRLPGVSGRVQGWGLATGTLASLSASATLEATHLAYGPMRFERLRLDGERSPDATHARLDARQHDGGVVAGTVTLRDCELEARVRADALSIALDDRSGRLPIGRAHGRVDLQLSATGPLEHPALEGTLALRDGAVAFGGDAPALGEVSLHAGFATGTVRLTELRGKLGSGRIEASGQATLDGVRPSTIDLVATTTAVPIARDPLSVVLDARLALHGERRGGALIGSVLVERGTAHLPMLREVRSLQSTGPLRDVVYTDGREVHRPPPALHTPIVLDAALAGPFHVRGKEVQVDLTGSVHLETRDGVRMRGAIEALPGGRLELLGRSYEVERARAGFAGGRSLDPAIDLRLTRDLGRAVIAVEATGSAKRPKLRFSSQPPIYDDAQVLEAVLSGDPRGSTTDRGLDRQITGALSSLVVGALKDRLAPQLPIDVIKVDTGETGPSGALSTRLEVGKYLTDSVYISYAHQFGFIQIGTRRLSANVGELRYRFRRSYALDLVVGDAPAGKMDLFWARRY
jgi:autotransporter translocation and assembly factor TamB